MLILLMIFPILLAAQEEEDPAEPDWEYYEDFYSRGDRTFIINLGVSFPTPFIYHDGTTPRSHNFDPPVGGSGSLAFNYYLTRNIFLGGEIGLMFLSTLGDNTVFLIPLGLRGGYQFSVGRFDFPLTAVIGMIWHRYPPLGYYGLYTKIGVAAYFRALENWSFGISSNWFWLPQWTNNKSKNVDGHVIDLTLSARYHF